MNNAEDSSPYGSGAGTGAASLDIVIREIPLGREFTEHELEQEVRARGLQERGAIREHLRSLEQRGHVQRSENGWKRVS